MNNNPSELDVLLKYIQQSKERLAVMRYNPTVEDWLFLQEKERYDRLMTRFRNLMRQKYEDN